MKLSTCVVWLATLRTCVPASLETDSSPTVPSWLGNSVMVLTSPSAAAWPATRVPRMPMVATGVRTTMASEPDLAIWPETKLKTPCTTENEDVPSPELASKTSSSITMRPSSPSENVVVSTKTTPTEAPEPVSMTSPWKIGEPEVRVTSLPSARVAVAEPSRVWTWPMGANVADSPA